MSTAWERLANEPILDIHTPEENARLIEALQAVLGKEGARP